MLVWECQPTSDYNCSALSFSWGMVSRMGFQYLSASSIISYFLQIKVRYY
jgi:hypothetical protein